MIDNNVGNSEKSLLKVKMNYPQIVMFTYMKTRIVHAGNLIDHQRRIIRFFSLNGSLLLQTCALDNFSDYLHLRAEIIGIIIKHVLYESLEASPRGKYMEVSLYNF